jgi:hypothetical protein
VRMGVEETEANRRCVTPQRKAGLGIQTQQQGAGINHTA